MIDPRAMYDKAMLAAEDYADKDHAAGVLDDALSTLEGVITADLKAKGESITIISKLVKNDERWREAAKAWRDAKKAALIAKLKYEQICRYQDNLRTNEVTTRNLS